MATLQVTSKSDFAVSNEVSDMEGVRPNDGVNEDHKALIEWKQPVDTENPLAWSNSEKVIVLVVVCSCSLVVTSDSSIVSSANKEIEQYFRITQEIATLDLSLYVAGLAFGPVFLSPLSEFFGRRPVYLASFALFLAFHFPIAFVHEPCVFFIFRFLAGAAGSVFLVNVGGTITDMWSPIDAFLPMALFSSITFVGPVLGPVIGGFIAQFSKRWQWTQYVIIIWAFLELIALFFLARETLGGIILTKRARKLRKELNNKDVPRALHELQLKNRSMVQITILNCKRVFILLASEPILLLLCAWTALQLGIIYLFFVFFPIVYQRHGFTDYQVGLAFLSLGVGNLFAVTTMPFFKRKLTGVGLANIPNPSSLTPEKRLVPSMFGCFLTPLGLYVFAFTSYPHVHWIGSSIGAAIFAMGLFYNFLSIFNYTATYYRPVAASALAANALIRCGFAAAFPLFGVQMSKRLGTAGAAALLASLNFIMIPVPFLLYRYGARLRSKSRFAMPPTA